MSCRIHPFFDKDTKQNDIAIVKLKTSMRFEKSAASIAIIDRRVSANEKLIFSGWGSTANNMEKDLLLFSDDFVIDTQCAGYENKNSDLLCARSK